MTLISAVQPRKTFAVVINPSARMFRTSVASGRQRFPDEDLARKALGTDLQATAAILSGKSLEHLARIAFG